MTLVLAIPYLRNLVHHGRHPGTTRKPGNMSPQRGDETGKNAMAKEEEGHRLSLLHHQRKPGTELTPERDSKRLK
jgi:hypothetical protein